MNNKEIRLPHENHPGYEHSDCPLSHTVTKSNYWGGIIGGGFACLHTGGHCLPNEFCKSRVDKHNKTEELKNKYYKEYGNNFTGLIIGEIPVLNEHPDFNGDTK